MQSRFKPTDIAIISCRGLNSTVFKDRDRVGNHTLARFTGEYDMIGDQILTDGRLTFDSVYRFKGQEAPAVILVDVDPNPDDIERAQRVLYCGMTRATVRLKMLLNQNNVECATILNA